MNLSLRRVITGIASPLALAGALVGFFLLVYLLSDTTSTGPDDLLAPTPSEGQFIVLPTGAGLVAFAIAGLGILLAIVALSSPSHWTRRGRILLPRRSIAIGAVIGVLVAGAGLYLAFSGVLTQGLSYEQHLAERELIDTKALSVMIGFFLSILLVALLGPRLLPVILLFWLLVALLFGFFSSRSLEGLDLFALPEEMEESVVFASEVERYRDPQLVLAEKLAEEEEAASQQSAGGEADGSPLYVAPRVVAASSAAAPVENAFTLTGATHVSLLRTATGDIYENGLWAQVDPLSLDGALGLDIPGQVIASMEAGGSDRFVAESSQEPALSGQRPPLELLTEPSAVPAASQFNHISLMPAGDGEAFEAGVLPVPAALKQVGVPGSWRPYSGTFETATSSTGNETLSLSVVFETSQLQAADPVEGTIYSLLPRDLPDTIHALASEITQGLESPYEKAEAIGEYLTGNYYYHAAGAPASPLEPPAGAEPMEWFLFDSPAGRASAFSTAFVLLARSADVPARVVSGWAVSPTGEEQTVSGSQAHQWAEIALQDIGWVTFDLVPLRLAGPSIEAAVQDDGTDGNGSTDTPGDSEDPIEGIISRLLNAADPQERADMARALAGVESEAALQALAEAMFNDPHPLVREAAIEALAQADLDTLVDTLLNHQDSLLRMATAAALGHKDDLDAVASLAKALDEDLDPEVRAAVAEALGELDDQQSLDALARALVEDIDPSEEVRQSVVEALEELANPEALEPLLTALGSDTSSSVRAAAASVLGQFGTDTATEGLAEAMAGDDEAEVRAAAASALGEVGDTDTLSQLIEARDEDSEAMVRAAAAEALGKFSSDQLQEALLESADASVRKAAAQLLGDKGDLEAASALVSALSDVAAPVRDASRDSLGEMGTLTALENGGALFSAADGRLLAPGATTEQATDLPHFPLFEVEGAAGVDFLRTGVGDTYSNGQWAPDYSVSQAYSADQSISNTQEIAQITDTAGSSLSGRITVRSLEEAGLVFQGIVPVTHQLTSISDSGTFYPDGLTFAIEGGADRYHWEGTRHTFSPERLQPLLLPVIHMSPNTAQFRSACPSWRLKLLPAVILRMRRPGQLSSI